MRSKYIFLLAAYKAKFLDESIASILSQDYKDFMLIISDDSSPENIGEIVSRYNDSRIIYTRNESNIGGRDLVNHWNNQLKCADSEYVIMASDDDKYDSCFLSKIDELVNMYPEVNLFRARSRVIDEDGDIISIDDPADEMQTELQFASDLYNGRHTRNFAQYVFKTATIKSMGGFHYLPYAWYSDSISALKMASCGVSHTRTVCFSYRANSYSITGSKSIRSIIEGKFDAAISYYEWMTEYIGNINFVQTKYNKIRYDELIRSFRHDLFATVISYFRYLPTGVILKAISKLRKGRFWSKNSFIKEYVVYVYGRIS